LLPQAESGLRARGIDESDIRTYLGVINSRVRADRTGAQWILDSLERRRDVRLPDARFRAVTIALMERQHPGAPVHTWELARPDEDADWRANYRTVGQIMTTDLFTVQPETLVDLAASVMEWRHVRHVPVEDADGRLVGLVSHRALLRLVARGHADARNDPIAVRDIMTVSPITVTPDTPCLDAIEVMREHLVGCLPVVDDEDRLVGIVSERDFMQIAERLFEERMREER
jgi:CBS domain-containing protein